MKTFIFYFYEEKALYAIGPWFKCRKTVFFITKDLDE